MADAVVTEQPRDEGERNSKPSLRLPIALGVFVVMVYVGTLVYHVMLNAS